MINLDKSRMGYFIFFKSDGSWISKQITKQQIKVGFSEEDACYTHIETCGGGQYSVAVIAPKTKVVDITKRHKGRTIRLVRYKNQRYEKKSRYKVAFWAASKCNIEYDWFGILAFKIKWLFKQSKRLFFCSELALWSLQKEHKTAMNGIAPEHCFPADFIQSNDFETVWEGKV